MRRLATFAIVVLLVSTVVAQNPVVPIGTSARVDTTAAQPTVATTTAKIPDLPPRSVLRIGAGDMLDVSVYGVPELSQKVRVSDRGDIYLPLVNYVHVGKLSTDEAQ